VPAANGIMWVNHHGMFERIAPIRDDDNASTAAVVYGLTMIAIGVFFTLMIAYLQRHSWLLKDGVRAEGVQRAARVSAFDPIAYALVTIVAIFAPYVALALYGLITVFFAVGSRTTNPG
jgi:hypothetical protein